MPTCLGNYKLCSDYRLRVLYPLCRKKGLFDKRVPQLSDPAVRNCPRAPQALNAGARLSRLGFVSEQFASSWDMMPLVPPYANIAQHGVLAQSSHSNTTELRDRLHQISIYRAYQSTTPLIKRSHATEDVHGWLRCRG